MKFLKTLYSHFVNWSLFEGEKPECKKCNGSKQIEVLVMGIDTEFVECPYCSNKSEYKTFQSSLANINLHAKSEK